MNVIEIPNIVKFEGCIPPRHSLVVYEKGGDPLDGYVLMGFDEVGLFEDELKNPEYCFVGGL